MAVTDYLKGSGTVTDPYIIHTAAAFKQFFEVDRKSGKYFEIAADIDMGWITLGGVNSFNAYVNGNGHKIFNVNISSYGWFSGLDLTLSDQYIKRVWIVATYTGASNYAPVYASNAYKSRILNSRLDITCGAKNLISGSDMLSMCAGTIFNYIGTGNLFLSAGSAIASSVYCIANNKSQINNTGVNGLISSDCFLPSYDDVKE